MTVYDLPPVTEPPPDLEHEDSLDRDHRGRQDVADAANEAERAYLAALVVHPETAAENLNLLERGDFWQPRHTQIYDAITEACAAGLVPDHPTLVAQLTKTGNLRLAGGHEYLLQLRDHAGYPHQLGRYAEIVRDATGLRRLDNALIDLRERIATTSVEHIKTSLGELSDLADQVATNFGPTPGDHHGRLAPGDAFILDRPKDVPTAWGDTSDVLWAQGEPLLIAGPAGVGKTTVAQQVVLAGIGLRDTALGLPVRPFRRVLYIAADRPPQAARSLERMVTEEDRAVLHEHLVIWKGPPDRDFAKHPDELTRMCAQVNADAVVIDSLKDVALGLSDDEVGAGLNSAIQRALVSGVEVLGLHHYRKRAQDHANREPKSLDELYGSTWITAGAGSVISLWGAAGDPVVQLRHLKQPVEEFGPLQITHDHTRGTTTIDRGVDLLQQLRSRRDGLTATTAARLLTKKDNPSGSDKEKARRKLNALVEKGLAVCPSGISGMRGEVVFMPAAREGQQK